MEKVYFTGGIQTVNDPVWGVLRLLQEKENEIIDWISKNKEAIEWVNEFQKMFYDAFEQMLLQYKAKDIVEDKQKHPKILRYELSHDGVGLIAYLADGVSYHIHNDELTPEQVSIVEQLLGMEG